MKKVISACLLVFILSTLAVPFTASAAAPSGTYGTDYIKYGDVDINQKIDIADALYTLKQSVNSTTLPVQKRAPGDVDQNAAINSTDALQILQYAVEARTSFTEEYVIDKIGGGTSYTSADGIPDKYQKKVTFTITNGTWSDNTSANKVEFKSLMSNGKYSTSGTASLTAPTGMKRGYGYTGGTWTTTVPTSVSGTTAVTYNYSFATRMTVNYTVQHYKANSNSSYPSSPTATETNSGYVNDTVTATAKTYAGYTLDTSSSTVSLQLKEESANNILKLYYCASGGNYITNYSKTNVENGAYTEDTTADTSFSVSTVGLRPYTFYNITKNTVSLGLSNNYDYKRLVYCLQGLLNRDFGKDNAHTSVLYANTYEIGNADSFWKNYIRSSTSIFKPSSSSGAGDGLTQVDLTTWTMFYNEFKQVIKACGIILWDGNVPATANVATTICGLDGYLPVLNNSPLHRALVADGVPVKMSLVGMFTDGHAGTNITGLTVKSTGSAKNDAYIWALNKYFSRCSSQYMAYVVDGAATLYGYSPTYSNHTTANMCYQAERFNCLYNHDYFVARRCFCFDLDPYAGEKAFDDPAQQSGAAPMGIDASTLELILQQRYQRANGSFGQLIGFPPWWCKYTTHYSLGTKDPYYIEWLFTEMVTCYNLTKEADASGFSSMTNASVFYKYVPKYKTYPANTTSENLSFDPNTFYYTIYMGDYDSSAWLWFYTLEKYIDSKRGTLPLMWGINPNLCYRVPMAFDYLWDNRTAKDYFVGGDGGAGYIIPEALYHDKTLAFYGKTRPASNPDAGELFSQYSKPFYDKFGYEMTGFIINGAQPGLTENIVKNIASYSPKLNFTNCDWTPLVRYGDTYFVQCFNELDCGSNSSQTMYDYASQRRSAGYNFGAYRTVVKTPTEISTVTSNFSTFAANKGMSVRYVDPYTYYNLIKSSKQGVNYKVNKTTIESFDSVNGFVCNYNTTVAIETNNMKEGSGAMVMQYNDVTGSEYNTVVGGMVTRVYSTPLDLSGYESIHFNYWLTHPMEGSGALQINFVTNGQDDGFNFLLPMDGDIVGWHDRTLDLSSPSATANNPDWSSIRAIRITYFNYDRKASPNYIMIDNLEGLSYN